MTQHGSYKEARQADFIKGLVGKLAEAERQRDALLDACKAQVKAREHFLTCTWCQSEGPNGLRCLGALRLYDKAHAMTLSALASVKGDSR